MPGAETQPAEYTITLPPDLPSGGERILVFSIAGTYEDPCPDEDCRKARSDRYQPPEQFDLTVEARDQSGQAARLPLSSYAVLGLPLETNLAKPPFTIVLPLSEIVLQHYEFPLAAFRAENPAFDAGALASISLVFDRTPEGVIVLDKIGLREKP